MEKAYLTIDDYRAGIEAAESVEELTSVYMRLYDAHKQYRYDTKAYEALLRRYAERNRLLRSQGKIVRR